MKTLLQRPGMAKLNIYLPLIFFTLLMFSIALFRAGAQQGASWWYALEQGKRHFREGSYGDALLSFEDARRQRQAMYELMEKDLIEMMSLSEARRLGDSLERVDGFSRERRYDKAAAAFDELYYRYPKESFKNSAKAALQALGGLKSYPEAEYWIGETYRAEGELELALFQFQKAYEQRKLSEKADFGVDLLYKIADIRKAKQEYTDMERGLNLILASDSLWSPPDRGNSFIRSAMTRTMGSEGAGRFLSLYRHDDTQFEPAHRLLGLYYYSTGRHSRAVEHLMFSFLIQNSVIIGEISRHEHDYSFESLESLAGEFGRPLIADYIEKTDYYKTIYYLGSSLYAEGKIGPARGLWSFLAGHAPQGEWRNRAQQQLRQPRVDRAVEMP